jgi:tetratricopeptide (TPR) repeat protein
MNNLTNSQQNRQIRNKYIDRAQNSINQKKIVEALKCYQELLKIQPNFVNNFFQRITQINSLVIKEKNEQLFNELYELYPELTAITKPLLEKQSPVDNIYHCSVPKAATRWIKRTLSDYRISLYSGLLPYPAEFVQDYGKNVPLKTIVTGTFDITYQEFVKLPKPENYKAFFVMRDPRDLVVSAYFSQRYSHNPVGHIKEAREVLNNLSQTEGIIYVIQNMKNVYGILESWIDASKKDSNTLLLKYEDLTGKDSLKYFEKLLAHCQIKLPELILKELIQEYSFQSLSQGRKQGEEDHLSHYRKGVAGDWQNYFNPEIQAKFEEITGDLIEKLGYLQAESKPIEEEITPEQKLRNQQVSQAQTYLAQHDIAQALKCYRDLLKTQPSFIRDYPTLASQAGFAVKNKIELLDKFVNLYPENIEALSPLIKSYSQNSNIYHCSVPKAATQWVRKVLSDYRVTTYSGMLPYPAEFALDPSLDRIPLKTIVTGTFALTYQEFIKLPKPENYKAFFVMRDPRDLVVSAYFSHRYSHVPQGHIAKTRKVLTALSLEDGILYTMKNFRGVFQILDSWINASQQDPNIMLFRYEDLTGDNAINCFTQLLNHCDIQLPNNLLPQLLDDHSFDKLSKGREQGKEDRDSHYRKGIQGDWQNYFDRQAISLFEELTGDLITRLGYSWENLNSSQETKNLSANFSNPDSLEEKLQVAFDLYQKERWDEALNYYQESSNLLLDKLFESYFYQGLIHLRQDRLTEAMVWLQKSLEIKSDCQDAYFYIGSIFFRRNELDAALVNFLKCLELNPNLTDAYFYLGEIYLKKGFVELSLAHRQKYQKLKNQ